MFLLVCSVLSLGLFIYAGVIALSMAKLLNTPAYQRNDSEIVRLGWKAGGMVICGVIVIIVGMMVG